MQTTYADTNDSIVGPDGLTSEHVVFIKRHEDVDLHALKVVPSCQLIAHVGYTALRSVHVASLIPIGINSPTGF